MKYGASVAPNTMLALRFLMLCQYVFYFVRLKKTGSDFFKWDTQQTGIHGR